MTISRVRSPVLAPCSGISLKTPPRKRASTRVEGRISWFFSSCGRKRGVPLKLRQEPQGPAQVASGKSSLHASCEGPLGIPLQLVPDPRSSIGSEAGTSGLLSSADMDLGVPMEFQRGVRPRIVWRHASQLSSRAVKVVLDSGQDDIGICGFLSRCHRTVTHAKIVFS